MNQAKDSQNLKNTLSPKDYEFYLSEISQAKLRTYAHIAIFVYCIYLHYTDTAMDNLFLLYSISAISTLLMHLAVIYKKKPSGKRVIAGIFRDHILNTFFLYNMSIYGSLLFFIYTFVTIGNGFRFGVKYLAISGAVAATGILCLMFFSPNWVGHEVVGAGLLLNLILITIYTGVLLKKLTSTQTKLEELATQDNLTGLPNRHAFLNRIEMSLFNYIETKNSTACIYFDLDGFKKVNDVHGHLIGDELLISVAKTVKGVLKPEHFLSRLGGDEFTIIVDNLSSAQQVETLASQVIEAIESIQKVGSLPVNISASIGIAYLSGATAEAGLDTSVFIKAADEAMYRAKRNGKGRYEVSSFIGLDKSNYKNAA